MGSCSDGQAVATKTEWEEYTRLASSYFEQLAALEHD